MTETIITFSLESQIFGIPVSCIKEISEKKLTFSGLYSNAIKNIILLRNDVIPLLSLKEFIGIGNETLTDKLSKILIVEHGEEKCGLLVDTVSHVRTVEMETTLPDTIANSVDKKLLSGMFRDNDNVVFILNVEAVFESFRK